MSAFLKVFHRELKRLTTEKYMFFTLLLTPIVALLVMFLTLSAGNIHKLPIAVLDNDNSTISRKLLRSINATPSCQITYNLDSLEKGYDLVKHGDIYAIVVIPKNFKKDLLTQKKPQIVYYYNNQTLLIGGVLTRDVQATVVTFMKGMDILIRSKMGVSKDIASSKINIIRVDEKVKANPYLNYSYFISFAGFAHVIQVFILLYSIWAIGREFKEGTTKQWLELSENSIFIGVFGKFSVYFIYFIILTVLAYGSYVIFYKAPFEGSFLFFIFATFLYVLAYQMIGLIMVAILANFRFALSSGAFLASLGFTISGITYPIIAMPKFFQIFSALIPTRPYVSLLVDQALRNAPVKYDYIYIVWLSCFIVVGICFMPILKYRAKNEDLWFKI